MAHCRLCVVCRGHATGLRSESSSRSIILRLPPPSLATSSKCPLNIEWITLLLTDENLLGSFISVLPLVPTEVVPGSVEVVGSEEKGGDFPESNHYLLQTNPNQIKEIVSWFIFEGSSDVGLSWCGRSIARSRSLTVLFAVDRSTICWSS